MPSSRRQSGASCFCFDNSKTTSPRLKRYQLDYMHQQSRDLIRGWFAKAIKNEDARPEESFEPFIYAWFSFNAWAACVTDEDVDSKHMKLLIGDEGLQEKFLAMFTRDAVFRGLATEFSNYWPIFSVKGLRRQDISRLHSGNRDSVVQHYLNSGATDFQPRCWQEHHERAEICPCDWPHTIAAIYRVRCNLFHGEKSAGSIIDQNVVHAAFRVLVVFMQNAQLF